MPIRLLIGALLFAAIQPLLAEQPCSSLSALTLPHTTITSAVNVPEGPVPSAGLGNTIPILVAARCEVQAITRPSKDSEIRLQVWLPVSGWNGKYLQVGNGGWAGQINQGAMADPLRRGYAVAATDDGHTSAVAGAAWAVGHPEKLIDFGYRAVHETSVQAKSILRAFFGRDADRSYFSGCSDGGREALMEAQRYPEDFDGIIAGAPANNWSHLFTGFVWNEQALAETPIPPAKLPVIQNAVVAACDALDGVKDGLLEDPRACNFDPASLLCKAADAPDCLTEGQVATLRKIYSGPKNPRTGKQIFPGWPVGTEAVPGGWSPWILPPGLQSGFGNSYYGQAAFEQSNWDFRTLNFDTDVEFGDSKAGPVLNATNPDLRSFRDNGGKLIQYHGWGDAAISPLSSIEYYESVRSFLGRFPDARREKTDPMDFYRLFLVPGMAHCGGGIGPNDFGNGANSASADSEHNVLTALETWVERGAAPAKLVGSGRAVDDSTKALTRPLCPYPQTAHYRGTGDPNVAENFACAMPADAR
ncbi:MAG TPA: tannase/feruloyl esterase family alpha/beta hydrolase [Bryobacteraceae bacterium]